MVRTLFAAILLMLAPAMARADVSVAKIFGNNMVLQRNMKTPVWGKAAPGEEVTVSILGQKRTTKADAKGNWMLRLDELKVGGPYEMTVQGRNTVKFTNVLVGEVWICSGQSNMAWQMNLLDKSGKLTQDAKFPKLRLNSGLWQECTPESALKFSATAYYFGVNLQKALGDVPVGLINRSVGGTSARLWTSRSAIESDPEMKPFHDGLLKDPKVSVGGLYESMIRPLIPYGMRGIIWYQGESDASRPAEYTALFKTMIRSWRSDWGQKDAPFLFAHLGAIGAPAKDPSQVGWGPIREAQSAALALPLTAVAAFHDSDADLHPRKKEIIGARLALAARGIAYGDDVVYSGPQFDNLKIDGNKAIVSFKHTGGGLVVKGNALKGFAIAGADGKFVWADAKIDGTKVIVTHTNVPQPVDVRYGFSSNPQCTLYNREDLPALPFRTDRDKK